MAKKPPAADKHKAQGQLVFDLDSSTAPPPSFSKPQAVVQQVPIHLESLEEPESTPTGGHWWPHRKYDEDDYEVTPTSGYRILMASELPPGTPTLYRQYKDEHDHGEYNKVGAPWRVFCAAKWDPLSGPPPNHPLQPLTLSTPALNCTGQALKTLERVFATYPDGVSERVTSYQMHVDLADTLLLSGHPMKAANSLEQGVLKEHPTDHNAMIFLGVCYYTGQAYERSLTVFSGALELNNLDDENMARSLLGVGMNYEKLAVLNLDDNTMNVALRYLLKALDYDDKSLTAYHHIGMICTERLPAYEKAIWAVSSHVP